MMRFLTTLLAAFAALTADAQVSDASAYFTNKPFGWVTCSSVDGKVYNINGGVGYGEPKTITLTASGGNDDDAVMNAIKKYDIIILDGSRGNFTIASQMKIVGAENKTIVGINNARLCTKFWLTPEIHTALKAAKLDGYSSTKQITGTLPDGQTVTMDERAFYTKKTMMEVTEDYSMSFAQSGIFSFDGSDENIIIRNIVFQGPGSVDVDGVDLISQYGGNHIWIDHCEFIDGMDGNLDTGKKEGLFVTYSWNIFRYTERSFSHPYSNGCGWLDSADPQLFITYANCIWGAGCSRRLPQVGATHLHLLNCHYDCAGNSVGCAVNGSNSMALIEGNYSEPGVNSPLAFSSDVRAYSLKGNYFATATQYNTDRNHNGGCSVPYEYTAIPCSEIRSVLGATHGAGATLDNDMVLPEVEASEKPNIDITGEYVTVKNWNFKKWSTETKAAMAANTDDWSPDGSNYKFNHTTSNYIVLASADGTPFPETNGLLFKFGSAGQTVVYSNSIRINKPSIYIKVPDCKYGDKLLITLKSANSSQERGFGSKQTLPQSFVTISEATNELLVVADGDVELYSPQGGVYLFGIELQRQLASGIENVQKPAFNVHSSTYNLQGQRVGDGYNGIVVKNGRKFVNLRFGK